MGAWARPHADVAAASESKAEQTGPRLWPYPNTTYIEQIIQTFNQYVFYSLNVLRYFIDFFI